MRIGLVRCAGLALIIQLAACTDAPEQAATANVAVPDASASANVGTKAEDVKLVVAFGDSLYAGYQLPQDEGFAPQLEEALSDAGIAARVHNAGVSGDTSAAGRQRLDFVLGGLERKPDLVVLGLGGNDMLRGLSPSDTRANLTAMLDQLQGREIPVVLTGMVAAPNMGADYARQFNAIFPDLAREYEAPLYPFFLDGVITNPALMLEDGIHPNEAGVDAVVEKLAPMVVTALEQAEK